jgi:hypothetical protein
MGTRAPRLNKAILTGARFLQTLILHIHIHNHIHIHIHTPAFHSLSQLLSHSNLHVTLQIKKLLIDTSHVSYHITSNIMPNSIQYSSHITNSNPDFSSFHFTSPHPLTYSHTDSGTQTLTSSSLLLHSPSSYSFTLPFPPLKTLSTNIKTNTK